MSDDRLEREMERLADGGGPPASWQDKVQTAIARPAPPGQRAPWPIALAGTGLAVAAVVTLLVIGLRGPEARPSTGPAAIDPGPARSAPRRTAGYIRVKEDLLEQEVQNMLKAKTEAERAAAERLLRETTKKLEAVKRELDKAHAKWPKLDDGKLTVKCDPNDPLCAVE